MSKKSIRKALENRLDDGMNNAIPIAFNSLPADFTKLPEHLRTAVSYGKDFATEIGMDPRIERSGTFIVQVRSDKLMLDDRNDEIANMVRACFPYGVDLVHDGIRVSIETIDDTQVMQDGAWLVSNVIVNWTVWSVTNA